MNQHNPLADLTAFSMDDMTKTASIIERSKVYIERLPHNNRRFQTKYSGLDPVLVMERALKDVKAIDI